MKKRLISLTLAGCMIAMSLAGCGGGSTDSETTTAGTNAGGETTASSVQTAEGDTILKWAVWDISSTVYYQPLIDAFEAANPGVKIEMVDLGSADYQTVLATELTGSGSDFDIATIKDVPGYTTLVNKSVLEPLDDYIAKDNIDLSLNSDIHILGNLCLLKFYQQV